MSDYVDKFMCDDDENSDLEYAEGSGSELDVDLENQYYNSKILKKRIPKKHSFHFNEFLTWKIVKRGMEFQGSQTNDEDKFSIG